MKTPPPAPSSTPERPALRGVELAAFGLVLLALGWAYAPSFLALSRIWAGDPNYSHGYFVVPFALAILWLRLPQLDRSRLAPSWWGWALLVGVFALRTLLYQINEQWGEDATIPLAAAGLALAFGGWPLLRWALPAVVFLGFMLPLPHRLSTILAYPLQRLATVGSCDILHVMGLPVLAEGNVILIGGGRLEVARACNGLSMLLSFVTLITFLAILIRRPIWEKIILLASAIPIALVVNVLRITITALFVNRYGTDEVLGLPHDWAGYLMMPMALVIVFFVELPLMSWLVIEPDEEAEGPPPTFGGMFPAG